MRAAVHLAAVVEIFDETLNGVLVRLHEIDRLERRQWLTALEQIFDD